MSKIEILGIALKSKAVIAVASASIFFVTSYYLSVMNVYQNSLEIYIQMNGFYYTIALLSLNAVIAVLIGVFVALIVYRIDVKKSGYGIGGSVIAAFSSGCPTCGAPLLSLLGFPLGLMALPLRGIEIKLISILMLLISIWIITSDKNYCNAVMCKIIRKDVN